MLDLHMYFSVRKIYSDSDLDVVKEENVKRRHIWERKYPNHIEWITRVIDKLKRQTYDRIVFGGYCQTDESEFKLCCSVMLKKNPYTPYLEIKNLIVFDDNYGFKRKEIQFCQRRLIQYIRKYAEERGYPKLITTLTNVDTYDRELIRVFLEQDFYIAGSQSSIYRDNHEVVYLASEVHFIYSYDPFDCQGITEWIINRHLDPARIENSDEKAIIETDKLPYQKNVLKIHLGKRQEINENNSKFDIVIRLLIIEDYYTTNNDIKQINNIKFSRDLCENSFVFDFSHNVEKKIPTTGYKYFNREEIESLIGWDKIPRLQRRLEYSKVGGLVLISNPIYFPFEKINEFVLDGINPVYVKLGTYGGYLTEGMPIYFAYYPQQSETNCLQIWAVGNLASTPERIDLNKIRHKHQRKPGTEPEVPSATQLLFERIDDDDQKLLWDKTTFERHNSYNASAKVVCFIFNNFVDYRNHQSELGLQEILSEDEILDIGHAFDFYLTSDEVSKILKIQEKVDKRDEAIKTEARRQEIANLLSPTLSPSRYSKIISDFKENGNFTRAQKKNIENIFEQGIDFSIKNINDLLRVMKRDISRIITIRKFSKLGVGIFGSVGRLERNINSDIEFSVFYEDEQVYSEEIENDAILIWNFVKECIEEIGYEWEGQKMFNKGAATILTPKILHSYLEKGNFPNKYIPIININDLLRLEFSKDGRLRSRHYQILTEIHPLYNAQLFIKLKTNIINFGQRYKSYNHFFQSSYLKEISETYYYDTKPKKIVQTKDLKKLCYRFINVVTFKLFIMQCIDDLEDLSSAINTHYLIDNFKENPLIKFITASNKIGDMHKEIKILTARYSSLLNEFLKLTNINEDDLIDPIRNEIQNFLNSLRGFIQQYENNREIAKNDYPWLMDRSQIEDVQSIHTSLSKTVL